MKRFIKILLIIFLLGILASIRFFETQLFYDPLIDFYHSKYLNGIKPEFEYWKLLFHTSMRFLLNTTISLLILFVAFKDGGILRFSGILYGVLFISLMVVFSIMLSYVDSIENYMPLFYVRRFLIQPILVILLLPAFYYYKMQQR